jgi:hypothetical protein
MMVPTPGSVFAAITRYFDDPRLREDVRLTVVPYGGSEQPVSLSLTEAREALYGSAADPVLAAAIWQQALNAAHAERPPSGFQQLLLIWLAVPQLTGTAYRICGRLRANLADVEAEMILAFLEGLRAAGPASPLSIQVLLKAARSSGWRFARTGLRESPSDRLENFAEDNPYAMVSSATECSGQQKGFEVQVARPDGPGGLHASLRFSVSAEHLEREVFNSLTREVSLHEIVPGSGHARFKHRIGTLSLHRPASHR